MSDHAGQVWVVDDDESVRWVVDQALRQASVKSRSFEDAASFLSALATGTPDVVITDIRMPGMDGFALLSRLQESHPDLPVIVVTAHSDLDSAVSAYQGGAFEYLPKPFDIDELIALVRRARGTGQPTQAPADDTPMPELIGQAPAMQQVFRSIGRLARSSMTVLITGESGTGKELVARALHRNSPRAAQPFIALNTSAIPSELLESELFGHERGAFTGADARRIGRFEQADGGTLFLDEIGDMPASLQTRLLRVLAEGEFYRVGGQTPIQVNVRVIAATHRDLSAAVEAGEFREDLFHRLNVMGVETPPLRERPDDVPILVSHYLARAADELEVEVKRIDQAALQHLVSFGWPGNVRQLVNLCRRLTVTAPGSSISVDDVLAEIGTSQRPEDFAKRWVRDLERWADDVLAQGGTTPLLNEALPAFEKTLILAALRKTAGQRGEAARLLGWGRNTLTRKIAQLSIDL
ncbi:MAG: nitrogen regulation protein NR(I) [Pseudomonadota bacterium]